MGAEINTNPLKKEVQKCVDFWDEFLATPSADFAGLMVSDQENIQQETQQKRTTTGEGNPQDSLPIPTRPRRGRGPPSPERISVACGNIPAPGLGKLVCMRGGPLE